MVEPNRRSLENRFGLLGPTRVRIPPPPLTTRIPANDAGSSKSEAGVEPASPTARNRSEPPWGVARLSPRASRSERDAGEGGARLPGACSTGNKCWGQVPGSPGALSRSRTLKVTASGLLPWFHGGVGNFVAPFGHELEMDILSTTKSTPASSSAAAGTRLSGGTNRRPPGPDP